MSSNIFSIGEQDAHDLLEEDLWEDFNKDDVTLFTSKDDRNENVSQNVNSIYQVSGSNNSSGFTKACSSTASNGDINDTLKRQDSKSHGLRPSASDSKRLQSSGGFASSFQPNVKDPPSTIPGSYPDGKRKCLTNLANHSNNNFVAMVTQNESNVPQKHTFHFKSTAHTLSHNVSSSKFKTLENADVDARTRPVKTNGGSEVGGDVVVHPAQVSRDGETTTKGFQKFPAAAHTVQEKMLNVDSQISNSLTEDGNDEINTDGHIEHSFDKDAGDSTFSSHRTVTSTSQLSGKTFRQAKHEVSLNSSGTALAAEKQPTPQFIPESGKSGLNSRRQLLPNRESHDEDRGKAVSANMSPPVSQFQKKNSVGHTPVSSWKASSSLRPTAHNGLNQSSTFQTYGNKGAATPLNEGRGSWHSPRPGNKSTPVNSSTRHKPTDKTSLQQFPSPHLPVFTPRVAQLCKTPTGPAMGRQTRSSRKFPGPAGILPKLSPGQDLSKMNMSPPSEEEREEKEKEVVPTSQDCGLDDFSQGAWKTMKAELGLDEKDPKSVLSQHNIASVLRKASMRQLQRNKVPHICVLIKLITFHVSDAVVTFRDPTGEMQGTLHRSLIEEYQSDLKPGCVLLLKQVGVLSPSLRNHYLNVTHKNVVQIFPPQQTSSQASPSSSQLKQRISPKSIKVNNFAEDKTHKKPEESSEYEDFPKRSESPSRYSIGKDDDRHASGLHRDENCPRREGGKLRGSERKRLSDEKRENGTKRVCLELSCKESQKKESKNMQPENTTQSEETIADLIEGFEDELFEDF